MNRKTTKLIQQYLIAQQKRRDIESEQARVNMSTSLDTSLRFVMLDGLKLARADAREAEQAIREQLVECIRWEARKRYGV